MASLMTDEQRLKALEAYDPGKHLIEVAKDRNRQPVLYYPANWRLYELSLRYPNANLDSEIIYQDDKGNIVVRARLWLGKNYEESEKKASAMKQGKLSELDKVEKKAKARAASDFGVGTEYALDYDDVDKVATVETLSSQRASRPEKREQVRAETEQQRKPVDADTPMTNQQWQSIQMLGERLTRPLPSQDALNYVSAATLITQWSQEYRQTQKQSA